MASLKNKTIWLTGASSGIGEALAYELAKKGATLILSGRNADKLQTVKQACKHSKRHAIVAFDITDSKASEQAYTQAKAHTGRIDWLINNAGISQRSLIKDTTEAVERQLMEVDYFAQTRLTRLALPDMIKNGGGKIVMISSVAGLVGTQMRGAYGAAKAALHMWANSLRAEHHADGIEVAVVFPGFVQTNISINALIGDGSTQGTMDTATEKGLTAKTFAKRTVKALVKGEEYIVVAGKLENLGALLSRVSPPRLYKMIRGSEVT